MTIPMRERIALKAREWLDTPYHHQQSVKGIGVDCLGLVAGVAVELGIAGKYNAQSFIPFKGYSRNPNPNHMQKAMDAFLIPVCKPEIGDIAWIETRENLPSHLAILVTPTSVIHADAFAKKVIESPLPGRPHTWWKYGGLDE